LNEKDVGNLADFYSHGVIEPAIIEHLEVTGCGKSYRLNIVAQRFVSDNELHFAAIAPGHTLVRIAKQRDAYTAAAFAVGISNKSKGGCGKGVSVYNTEVLTTPANETSSWDEIWYMSNCGVDVPIKVTLKPKATGSSLDVGAVPYN
jgi:hypothetical protein